jgi:DNA-binding transcriptional ArsR family regulator
VHRRPPRRRAQVRGGARRCAQSGGPYPGASCPHVNNPTGPLRTSTAPVQLAAARQGSTTRRLTPAPHTRGAKRRTAAEPRAVAVASTPQSTPASAASSAVSAAAPEVSRHLAVLRRAGLLTTRRRGRYVLYELDLPASARLGGDLLEAVLR